MAEGVTGRGTAGPRQGFLARNGDGLLARLYREHLVALHGFVKKTRTTPDDDLALARKRKKEMEE
jgi:hypothetical protein